MYVFLVRFDANEVSTDGIEASSDCHIDIQQTTSWTVHHDAKGMIHRFFNIFETSNHDRCFKGILPDFI